jgi:hypothetical protein
MHSHAVTRVRLASDPSTTYILKTETDPIKARTETLTQEFFRLIIPHQPQTFLINDNTQQRYLILSEESIGYTPLSANGTYTGLGQALACALFLEEADLKNGNIGVDNQNRIIKIDGDHGLGELMKDALLFALTAECIANPLKPPHFAAYNWLDHIRQGKLCANGEGLFKPNLSQEDKFRAEFNQGLLRIINLSNEHIQALVLEYFSADLAQKTSQLLCSRRDTLKTLLEQDDSFRLYRQSAEALADQQHFNAHLEQFQTNGVSLSSCIKNIPLKQLKQDCLTLIARIIQHHVPKSEAEIREGLTKFSQKILSSQSMTKLKTYHDILTNDLKRSLSDDVFNAKERCFTLIQQIRDYKKNDAIDNDAIDDLEEQCQLAQDIGELTIIKRQLDGRLRTLNLRQFGQAKDKCADLIKAISVYNHNGQLTHYLNKMSNKINNCTKTDDLYDLQAALIAKEYDTARQQTSKLFHEISSDCSIKDTLWMNYLEEIRQKIQHSETTQQLKRIEDQLNSMLNMIDSEEVRAVKQLIHTLSSSYSTSKQKKAAAIEQALYATPLEARHNIISSGPPMNPVQLALAQHRHMWDKLFNTNPANSFITLKQQFKTTQSDKTNSEPKPNGSSPASKM